MLVNREEFEKLWDESCFGDIDPTYYNEVTRNYYSEYTGEIVMTDEQVDSELLDLMNQMGIPTHIITIPDNLLDLEFEFVKVYN